MFEKIFGKKDKKHSGPVSPGGSVGSASSNKKKNRVNNKKKRNDEAGASTEPKAIPIPAPATAALDAVQQQQHHHPDEDEVDKMSWASSLSGGFSTPGSTDDEASHHSNGGGGGGKPPLGGHHRCTSMPSIPGQEGCHTIKPSTSSSSLKKASLRRTSSVSNGGNPKSLRHSTSAIGLDEMMEDRREFGTLGQNVVHMEVPFGKPIEEVYDGIHNGPVLGSGISGMVRLATHKATGIKYAVKVLDLGLVESPEGLKQLREEIYIMCQLDHPNIVRLEEVYESHSEIYLVQELCLGGELFDRLDEQPDYHYTESECARLIKQMLCAVRYLHSKGIIHRDLKLENFLFSSVHPDSELKMIDFGLSKHFKYGEVQHEAVGTPYTVAPEVISGSYDERCDIWAIGVIAFLLLSGDSPFGGCGGPEPLMTVRSNILKGAFAFEPEEIWSTVSDMARKFIKSLLVTDPKKRPTAEDLQKHQWLTYWHMRGKKPSDAALNPNVVKALVNFKEFSDMRKLLCEVLSFTLLPDQIRDLRREFEKMDTDGSGEISLTALKQVLMTNAVAGSLGALTEDEVTDIFNAMRVRKTEARIHWHEFIAAGLSQCSVDDRNLRLAFERLDSDHKGYITLDDIMDLMGSEAIRSEDAMRRMWGDSMKAVKCQNARITYDDFLLLMKGQTRDHPVSRSSSPVHHLASSALEAKVTSLVPTTNLHVVPEEDHSPEIKAGERMSPNTPDNNLRVVEPSKRTPSISPTFNELLESPLSMDDNDDICYPGIPGNQASLTPPSSPVRGAADYVTPRSGRRTVEFIGARAVADDDLKLPGLDSAGGDHSPSGISPSYVGRPDIVRNRSVSLDETSGHRDDSESKSEHVEANKEDLHVVADIVRDMLLPETDHKGGSALRADNSSKSALVINRKLYRAHRQMRLAVFEASKRFEEQQAQHAKEVLIARQAMESGSMSAGLVMRHGYSKQISREAIQQLLSENHAQQQQLLAVASKKGGRGKRTRKKTISDMSGMLTSIGQDETSAIGTEASEAPIAPLELVVAQSSPVAPEKVEAPVQKLESEGPSRKATVPGDFRKTNDPFSPQGRYGAIANPM